ncbi:MAG: TIGR02300 family protein [Alphaproteobacteria bacterium]|nr:TIGR02300 family protein [Alphaproteobacteria bacterium]
MPKEEWGTKRLCPETGKRFYDLNKTPVVSPYTGNVVNIETSKTRTMVADAEDAQTKKMKVADEEDDLVLDDEDDEDEDVDLGDDVLEDDDDDTVSLDDIADVSKGDDD